MDGDTLSFFLDVNENNIRLDKFIAEQLPQISRSYVQKLIEDGYVLVNGGIPKTKAKINDKVVVYIPPMREIEIKAEDIKLDIVYEDDALLVINKPQGMVVHPANGNNEGTLVNALMHHCKFLSGINGQARPGIVHRIDKDTSGLLLVAKNDKAHISLSEQIRNRTLHREYKALVYGNIKSDKDTISAPIGRSKKDRKKMAVTNINSRPAVTHYEVIKRYNGYTLIYCKLETGRTHQIRVHLSALGHSVVGDKVYGPQKKDKFNLAGQLLTAVKVGFIHPDSLEYMEFSIDLPYYFENVLNSMN